MTLKQTKNQKIPCLSALEHEGISARFFPGFYMEDGRQKELNCKLDAHKSDIAHELGCNDDEIITLKQIHSNIAHIIEYHPNHMQFEGDALITKERGIYIGVKTADCCPILLHDPKVGMVAAIHAGWRGALSGVIENTIAQMQNMGSIPENIHAALGPCIMADSYEVGAEFKAQFMEQSSDYALFFHLIDGNVHFDLPAFVAHKLQALGVRSIEKHVVDTFSNPVDYHSCRRAAKAAKSKSGAATYGCQLSVIGLCNQL